MSINDMNEVIERIIAEDKLRTGETPAAPEPQQVTPPLRSPHAPLPIGTQPLLDAQLGEALKIMRDYADWVHHPHSDIVQCVHVGHALGSLMASSAALAKVSVEFQRGQPESCHRVIVEHAQPPRGPLVGRGRRKVENE